MDEVTGQRMPLGRFDEEKANTSSVILANARMPPSPTEEGLEDGKIGKTKTITKYIFIYNILFIVYLKIYCIILNCGNIRTCRVRICMIK